MRDPITPYAEKVVAGKIVAGRLVRLACRRHLDDYRRGHERGLKFDVKAAHKALDFFPEFLRLSEGEPAGQPADAAGPAALQAEPGGRAPSGRSGRR
jgi:phage terminase large subunit-like protein